MLNLTGLTLIICGFIAPYFSGVQISQFFFWPGFLILLRSANPFLKMFAWRKWARIGVLLNMAVAAFFHVLIRFEYYSLFDKLFIIMNPIGPVIHLFFPIKMSDEKVIFGSFRSTISIFLSILIYVCIGILIEKLIKRMTYNQKVLKDA